MMQSLHSSLVSEAIMTLRAKGFLHEKIAKSINNAGLGPISKGTVCYNVKNMKEPTQNPIRIFTASNVPSRLYGMILIQK